MLPPVSPHGARPVRPHTLASPQASGGKADLKDLARARFPARVESGELNHLARGAMAQKIRLADQYRLYGRGDVARRLELHKNIRGVGVAGVHHLPHHPNFHHRYPYFGRVSPRFTAGCFTSWYAGPSYLALRCWYPRWSPWVHWSWHYPCHPIWDPRPIWCRPILYEVAPAWSYYMCPVWEPLPLATCGTWVDVPPLVVRQQYDLQLLAVRFVDPGHPEEQLGPRYRVWFRNNSDRPITQPFNVTLLASNDTRPTAGALQAGVRVASVEAGDVQSIDVRLPFEVSQLGRDAGGQPMPFGMLHALVDSNREVAETNQANNGASLARAEVLPVDPAAFEADPKSVASGGEVILAGEGFGPEPGRVVLQIGGQEIDAEILGWYDLGVRVKLPDLAVAGPTRGDLIVVRGDGAAANPLQITVGG